MEIAPELGVAIATVNRPLPLVRCVEALLAGPVLPAEIIVVDQSSDDATRVALAAVRSTDVPVHYVLQKRRGLSASRNAAIAASTWPIIAFTDDDCVPDGGWVGAIDRAFALPVSPDAVTGRVLPLGPAVPNRYAASSRNGVVAAEFSGKTLPWRVGTGGNFAVRRNWFAQVGPYDERLGAGSPGGSAEDLDIFYRLLRCGARVRFDPAVVVFHERQDLRRRMATRWSYGYGLGAFCGIWLRRGDRYMTYVLARGLFDRARSLPRTMRRGQWTDARGHLLYLQGIILGLGYGLRQTPIAGNQVWGDV